MPQKKEGRLRVLQAGQGSKHRLRFVDPVGHGVLVAKAGGANGRPKQSKGTRGVGGKAGRKSPDITSTVGPSTRDEFALGGVHMEANLPSCCDQAPQTSSDRPVVAGQADVVQVAENQVGLLGHRPTSHCSQSWLQSNGKQQGAKWVALLDASFRSKHLAMEQ